MKFLSSLTKKDLQNKICLLRVDLNIQNADLFKKNIHPRILAVLPTIEFLIKNKAKVVILSHRGRPAPLRRGISKSEFLISKQFSLKPFAKILSYLLKKQVHFMDLDFLSLRGVPQSGTTKQSNNSTEIASPSARNDTEGQFRNSTVGSIFLLENLRFFDGEEKNDIKLAKQLALLAHGDIYPVRNSPARRDAISNGIYINDAFAVSHRANASVAAITKFLPSYAGLLLEKEIKNLDKVMKNPQKPLVMILGGAKISDKIGVIKNFLKKVKCQKSKVNCILLGGGMANTFLAAQGLPVGDSLYDADLRGQIRGLTRIKEFRQKVILPIDALVYKRQILDIGPKTIEKYSKIIENAGTIIWNGPMGHIEDKKFRKGSEAIAKSIIKSKSFSVIGGGETTAAFQAATRNYAEKHAELRGKSLRQSASSLRKSALFLSTGGGAMLEYLAGKKLPGLMALESTN
ncbi:MAG: phosphoglycerate kinase [bacterium]|nr:phosphoglycerate kinase [bacterium]